MNHLIPASLCLGLALVACDRRDAAKDISPETSMAETHVPQRGHAPREAVPGSPEQLRYDLIEAEKIELPVDREKAIAEVAWNALETDPELAAEAFLKLPHDSPERLRLIQYHGMRLAESDPEAAIAWADGLESEQETAAAKGVIALTLAETEPLRAANLISESGIAGREFEVAVVQIIQRWAAKDPVEAVAWVASFPASPARQAGIRAVA
ncbi:MAG TPA: hypothetical protein VLD18_02345, partial [Verrucomicrobiae bacterium]|nr:hypothetical protein [Verrucomicrobiae bacterium]